MFNVVSVSFINLILFCNIHSYPDSDFIQSKFWWSKLQNFPPSSSISLNLAENVTPVSLSRQAGNDSGTWQCSTIITHAPLFRWGAHYVHESPSKSSLVMNMHDSFMHHNTYSSSVTSWCWCVLSQSYQLSNNNVRHAVTMSRPLERHVSLGNAMEHILIWKICNND